jgi:Tol biopolymer transport system component
VLGVIGEPLVAILDPAISPDGKKVAVRGRATQGETEHTYILEGTTKHRLTTNEGSERHQFWSPKGDRILFSMQVPGQGNVSNLFIRNADGSGSDEPLVVSTGVHKWAPSWSPDGKTVVYHINDTTTMARDIAYIDIASKKTDFLAQTPATEALPRFNLDGSLVGYQAQEEGGKFEVWVTTFPKSNNKWKISTNGGQWPRFSQNEIFYWEGNNLMAVKFTGRGASFKTNGAPVKLFAGADVGMGTGEIGGYNFFYDYRDGKFVVVQRQ